MINQILLNMLIRQVGNGLDVELIKNEDYKQAVLQELSDTYGLKCAAKKL